MPVSFSAIEQAGSVAIGPEQGSRHDCERLYLADMLSLADM
ncbi:hypothetical protein J2X68_006408 [Streptomyces sp. 3330]|nr:hypothetical protein [Streptomyces sp. 3330]MDR6979671.1 hypothetical protein [Streptomyces sp. 3330]